MSCCFEYAHIVTSERSRREIPQLVDLHWAAGERFNHARTVSLRLLVKIDTCFILQGTLLNFTGGSSKIHEVNTYQWSSRGLTGYNGVVKINNVCGQR